MPRKRDGDTIREIFENVLDALKAFDEKLKGPLKAHIHRENIDGKDIGDLLEKARSASHDAKLAIEKLQDNVADGKKMTNSRFARHIVARFLESS